MSERPFCGPWLTLHDIRDGDYDFLFYFFYRGRDLICLHGQHRTKLYCLLTILPLPSPFPSFGTKEIKTYFFFCLFHYGDNAIIPLTTTNATASPSETSFSSLFFFFGDKKASRDRMYARQPNRCIGAYIANSGTRKKKSPTCTGLTAQQPLCVSGLWWDQFFFA